MKPNTTAIIPVFLVSMISFLFFGCMTPLKEDSGGVVEKPELSEDKLPEEDAYTNIEKLIEDGNQKQAAEELRKLNKDDSDSVIAYAGLLMAAGEYPEAVKILNELIGREPHNADAYFNLALVKGLQGLDNEQVEYLDKAIAADSKHSDALSVRGSLYLSESKLKKAAELFKRALETNPDNIIALTGYGSALVRMEEYQSAEEYLDRAVVLDPDNPFTYLDRSSVRTANGNMEGAEEDLTSAIRLEPDYFWHYIDRGRLRIRDIGDRKGALEDFNRAIELNPDIFYPYVFRAGIYDETGRLEKAAEDYKTVIKMKPEYHFAYSALGIVQFMLEDWDGCRKSFEKAFTYEADQYAYLSMAALAVMKKGDVEETNKICKRYRDKVPSSDVYSHILRAFMEKGYDSYALRLIQEEEDKTEQKRLLFYIAELYHEQGMETAAYSYFTLLRDAGNTGLWESRIAAAELESHYE